MVIYPHFHFKPTVRSCRVKRQPEPQHANDATPLIAKDKLISFWYLCLPVAIAACPFYLDDLYPL